MKTWIVVCKVPAVEEVIEGFDGGKFPGTRCGTVISLQVCIGEKIADLVGLDRIEKRKVGMHDVHLMKWKCK